MQAAINPALQAAMTLDRAAQAGEFRPMTPQGQPTVTAQLMQQAMQPQMPPQTQVPGGMGMMAGQPVQQAAQQAGIGAQIQQMQQQQAQQAMMQQAMQQQQQPPMMAAGGIASLNPRINDYADGGIVGYAAGELTEDSKLKQLLRRLPESSRLSRLLFGEEPQGLEVPAAPQEPPPMQDLPIPEIQIARPAPSAAPGAAPSAGGPMGPSFPGGALGALSRSGESDIAAMMEAATKQRPTPTSQDVSAALRADQEARRAELIRQGINPDLIPQQIAQTEDYYRRRGELLAERERQAKAEMPQQGLIEFLLGARGSRFGETMGAGAARGRAYEAGMKQQIGNLQDLQMEMEGLKIDKVNTLKQLQYNTATGQWDAAKADQMKLWEISRKEDLLKADLYKTSADLRMKRDVDIARIEEQASARREQAGQHGQLQNVQRYQAAQDRVNNLFKTRENLMKDNQSVLMMDDKALATAPGLAERKSLVLKQVADIDQSLRDAQADLQSLREKAGLGGLAAAKTEAPPASTGAPTVLKFDAQGRRIQ